MLELVIIIGLVCVILPVKYDPAFYYWRKKWSEERCEKENPNDPQ